MPVSDVYAAAGTFSAAAANDPSMVNKTWVLITDSPDGGWGIAGHANTSADIVAAARKDLS